MATLGEIILKRVIFEEVENELNIRFSLDAGAANCGNAHVINNYCSQTRPFTSTSAAGHNVWLHAQPKNIYAYTRHYLQCKEQAPHNTSACFVVPIWGNPPPPWLDLFAGMHIIRKYPAGADIFVQPGGKAVTSPYDVMICYDPVVLPPPPPKPVLSCVNRLLAVATQEEHEPALLPVTCTPTMIFPLSCNSVAGTALADSGASDSFARHAYIKAAGIKILPCPEVRINLADGDSVLPVLGMAREVLYKATHRELRVEVR